MFKYDEQDTNVKAGGKSAYLSLKMEVICSSETSVDFQWTTQRCIPEGSTFHELSISYPVFYTVRYFENKLQALKIHTGCKEVSSKMKLRFWQPLICTLKEQEIPFKMIIFLVL
jgi:hypothetical protein